MWRFSPFREMQQLRRELDRVFDDFQPWRFRSAFLPGRSARGYPLINTYEDADAIYVEALAPGLDADSLDLSIHDKTLTISGEKKGLEGVPAEAFHRNERAAGKFVRTLAVDVPVAADQVSADYENGILTITLPKAEDAKPRQISVKVK